MRHLSSALFLFASLVAHAQSITSTSSFTWSPSLLTVDAGTDIAISVTGNHHMREVSEATWNANGSTSNGGFDFGFGNHTLNLTIPGTYYYVCVPHASMGMKGRIIVESNTGVVENIVEQTFSVFPNPAKDEVTVTAPRSQGSVMSVVDVRGREVMRTTLSGTDRIAVDRLPEGNYTALLLDGQGVIRERKQLVIVR